MRTYYLHYVSFLFSILSILLNLPLVVEPLCRIPYNGPSIKEVAKGNLGEAERSLLSADMIGEVGYLTILRISF